MRIESLAIRLVVLSVALTSSEARADARLEWVGRTLPFVATAAAARNDGFVLVGPHGAVAITEGERFRVETLSTDSRARSVWVSVEGDVFVATGDGRLHVRGADGAWQTLTSGCETLEAVTGRSRTDVLVGGRGCLRHFDGRTFTELARIDDRTVVHRIVVSGTRVILGGTENGDSTPIWYELTRGALATIHLSAELGTVLALEPSGARDWWIAGESVTELAGRTYVSHLEDGPNPPRAFIKVGAKLFVTSDDGVYALEGRTFRRLSYYGPRLLALSVRGATVEGVTADGVRARIDATSAVLTGGRTLGAKWICASDDAVIAYGERYAWSVRAGSVTSRAISALPPGCVTPGEEAGRSMVFTRGAETYAARVTSVGTEIVRREGDAVAVLADPWAVARFPGAPTIIGGEARASGAVFVAGTGFFVRFDGAAMTRYRLGSAGRMAPNAVAEIGGVVRAWGGSGSILRWDGRHFREDVTPFENVEDVAGSGSRIVALGVSRVRWGSDFSDDVGPYEAVDEFGEGYENDRALPDLGAIAVRRDGGHFAPIDSAGDLVSGLSGAELGPVTRAFGASASDVWADTGLGLAHFDGARWTRAVTYEPHPIAAIAGAGTSRIAVSVTGRVLSLEREGSPAERIGVRATTVSAYVAPSGTAFVGGVGFIAERGASGWSRTFTGSAEDPEGDVQIGGRPSPSSPAYEDMIEGFAWFEGRVHALTGAGRWLVRGEAAWEGSSLPRLAFPSRGGREEEEAPVDICAVLMPGEGRVIVVSCGMRAMAVLDGTTYRYIPIPGRVRITGATCIAGDACYFFHGNGMFRADPSSL